MKTLYVALIAVFIYKFVPWRNNLERADVLINQKVDDRYDELCEYVVPGADLSTFWTASDGLQGLIDRIHIAWRDIRIVQAHLSERHIAPTDGAAAWYMMAGQLIFTVLAFPEAIFSLMFDCEHRAALKALKFYCQLVLRTNTLCFSAKCPMNGRELL
jgi:hypothetical protein